MLLGKRPRPPIKRTTSMTEFSLDLNNINNNNKADHQGGVVVMNANNNQQQFDPNNPFMGLDQRFMAAAAVSPSPRPRNLRRNSADFHATADSAHFLKACALCKRRLIPGRDIYMYRGDSAFCSLECRQQQMTQDERKEKCSLMASKKEAGTAIAGVTGSKVSGKGETVAAV
ncbi:OLC1v1017468C1 [Oldenlandia corymbosa var. corymbosa]|uniref:OLC1v1017468C1 n=1 Tax=Oldenlandia corymbosa var. corymbosa TaxID=529605 RepID=A0AAV1E9K4_OLDCO|nr:OLC1v1017468C1 [Oldenlandia corymbosa var. corymbosa]